MSSISVVHVTDENAALVRGVFETVYGDAFPVKYVYSPQELVREIRAGKLSAALAVDEDGAAAGYVSIYKSAPNPRLWEIGNMVVVPAYKSTDAAALLSAASAETFLFGDAPSDGLFSESVCSHYFTQVGAAKAGLFDCAIQLDQLDGASFKQNRTGSARISCVLSFREDSDPVSPLHLPTEYAEIIRKIVQPLRPRIFRHADASFAESGLTRYESHIFDSSKTRKVSVCEIGADFPAKASALISGASQAGTISLQFILNLGVPQIGAAVRILRAEGFFLAGMAPRWFGSDGLVLQKLFNDEPEYDKIMIYNQSTRNLLEFVRSDLKAVLTERSV